MFSKNSLRRVYRRLFPRSAERTLGVEPVNICNLHCSYCLRDEEMLYGKARFLDPARLFDLLDRMPPALKPMSVALTGGEPLLHPRFDDIVRGLAHRRVKFRIVTNGWHFDRIHRDLHATREALVGIAFSLDGADRASHDRHRGAGSFDRVMRALALCEGSNLPFQFNVVLRRDTSARMESIAVFAARLGARSVNFGAMLPTSVPLHREWGLTREEELEARREAAALTRILRIPIKVSFGLYDPSPGPHCPPLSGRSLTLDYTGRLRLCGNLSSFRGIASEGDVPEGADTLSLEEGWARIALIGSRALRGRDEALSRIPRAERPDPIVGSPCLSCLNHFDKLNPGVRSELLGSWHGGQEI